MNAQHSQPVGADYQYMSIALRLAAKGMYTTDPNPRVGCVIVKNGKIVGSGSHQRAGGPHAEVFALREAGENAQGATVYVTLEPCNHHGKTPPCADALINAKVSRVVAAMQDPNPLVSGEGLRRLAAAGIATETGILQKEAEALNPGFAMRMRRQRPWVRCKLAMSVDGRLAMANGESQWITGEDARRDAHRLRARSSAILTGINTVLADDPSLNVRLEDVGEDAVVQPLRVVIDSRLRMPPAAKMLSLPGNTLIATLSRDAAKAQALRERGAEVVVTEEANGRVDLRALLRLLAERQINELMTEAGPTLNGELLQHSLVDELIIYMAPCIMGNAAKGLFNLPGLEAMRDRFALEIRDIRAIGRDWRLTASVRGAD